MAAFYGGQFLVLAAIMQLYVSANQITSILHDIAQMGTKRPQTNKCFKELKQIYVGIHLKEEWALKGKLINLQPQKDLVKMHLNESLFGNIISVGFIWNASSRIHIRA